MKEYYVYVYLDPRKQGNFSYENLSFLFEPFYVGKGKNNRKFDHLHGRDTGKNQYKKAKIKNILSSNQKPIIKTLYENLLPEEAEALEIKTILNIGRFNDGGPLTNMTNGGEGSHGRIVTEETKRKISMAKIGTPAWNKGLTKEDHRVNKYVSKRIGTKRTEESKKRQSKTRRKLFKNGSITMCNTQNSNWKPINEAFFKRIYEAGTSYEEMKKIFGVNNNDSIIRRVKLYGLKRRKQSVKGKDDILKALLKQNVPVKEIIKQTGISKTSIYRRKAIWTTEDQTK